MTRAKPQDKKSLTLRIGEYMAGTTVEEFAKWKYKNSSRQKKRSASRDVIKLEITTDDETEADTLKLTYPRSGRSVSPAAGKTKAAPKSTSAPAIESESESESASGSESDATVKKVRFETVTRPRKSALKKKARKLKSDYSSDNTSSNSDSSKVSRSSNASSSESSSSSRKKDKKKKKKSKPSTPEASSDDTDAELKVECNCPKCRRKRMKLRLKNKKVQESDSEASQSEAEIPPKAKRPKQPKKAKKKSQSADTDSGAEPSSSALDTETETELDTGTSMGSETETASEAKEEKSAKNKNVKANKQQNKSAKQGKGGASKQAKGEKIQGDKVKGKKKDEKQETREAVKKSNYPEAAMLSPHARRPHLTEPVRAEVVQMERVIEGPEDPYPNAYYDAEHGIMRYYQGPVYGSRGSQPLYPKRDPNFKPLPIGVPHPSRNPYYNGFKGQDAIGVPYGQGTGPAYGPAGYPPPPHGYGPPYQAGDRGTNRDGPGDGPKLGQNNPYYNNRKSRFSTYGSNMTASGQSRKAGGGQHHSPMRSHNNNWGWAGSQNYATPGSPMRDNWATGSRHGSQRGGGADKPPSRNEWDADQNNMQGPSGGVSAWDATANSDHGNNNQAPGRTGSNDSWGQAQPAGGNGTWSSPAKGATSPQFDNVGQAMPGSWMPDTQYTSTWGDNTMAASTGGAVDQPGGEWDNNPTDPVW